MTPRRRWPVVLAVIAAVALPAGVLLARAAASAGHTPPASAVDAEPRRASHVPSEPTEQEAVKVALQLAAAPQRWLYLSDVELTTAVQKVASPRTADRLIVDVTGEVTPVRDALRRSTGRIWWIVRPLAWRVDAFAGDRASVSVWTVSILSASDVAVPQSDWFTSHFDLEWVDGTWMLAATRDEPGPTPQLGGRDEPWQPEPFDDALVGFTRVPPESAS